MSLEAFEKLPEGVRTDITNVCLHEFVEKGYRLASTNAIVDRLGISKGSIFYWFGTKDGLYLYLVNLSMQRFSETLRLSSHAWPDEILSRFRVILESSLTFLQQNPDYFRLFSSFIAGDARHLLEHHLLEGHLKEQLPEGLSIWENWFRGVDTTDFRSSPEEIQKLLMWVMTGLRMEVFATLNRNKDISLFASYFAAQINMATGLLAHAIYRHPERYGYAS